MKQLIMVFSSLAIVTIVHSQTFPAFKPYTAPTFKTYKAPTFKTYQAPKQSNSYYQAPKQSNSYGSQSVFTPAPPVKSRKPAFGRTITAPKNNLGTLNGNRYDSNSLSNPYGAGSKYKTDGLKNPFSKFGSAYSNTSAANPYATQPPKMVDEDGKYLGELSKNKYRKDSVSNPFGKYGNPHSPSSVNNPFGAGNPYLTKKIFAVPNK